MRKLKLLCLLCLCTVGGALSVSADDVFKDVTSTYLKNEDFEGEYTEHSRPRNDGSNARAIYKPNNWTVGYSGGNSNDCSAMKSGDLLWDNFFKSLTTAPSGGSQTYWMRLHSSGNGQRLTLSQTVSLQKGTYKFSASAYFNNTGYGSAYIQVGSSSSDRGSVTSNATWQTISYSFTSDGSSKTLYCGGWHQNGKDHAVIGFDNVKLELNLTQSLKDLIAAANSFIEEEEDSYSTLQSVIDAANAVKESTDASTLETQYNALNAALDLAKNHRKPWLAAWTTANTNYASDTYANVTGSEKTALKTEIDKSEPNTADDYDSAQTALIDANSAFTGAKASYDAYASASASAPGIIEADVLATVIAGNATATAADAQKASEILPKAYASKDGTAASPYTTSWVVNGSFDSNINGWSRTGSYKNNQRAGKSQGTLNNFYENWNGTAAAIKMYQTINNIPNGTYVLCISAFVNTLASPNESQFVYINNTKTYLDNFSTTGSDYHVSAVVTNNAIEIGLEQTTATANWMGIDNVVLKYCGTGDVTTAAALQAALNAYDAAKDNAENTIANTTDYGNVTGEEKTTLQATIDADGSLDKTSTSAVETATRTLLTNTLTFTAAKTSYDGLAAARITGATYTTVLWPRASAAKKTALDDAIGADAPTDAEDAVTKTNDIVTAYRQFVESNGLAEGVAVAVNKTSELLVSDASISTSGWTSGSIGTNTNEGYTDGSGSIAGKYFDGGWSASAGVNITLTQNLTLPAGQYQLQITARGSDQLTSYTMSIGGESVDLPTESSTGGTFGRGWSDKYVTFESDGSELTLTIAATSTEYQQWISFNRLRLVKLDATLADATDYSALADAISDAEANLGFEDGQYAPYNNVESMTLLAAAKAIDPTTNNVQKDVQDATTALEKATWTANDGDVDAIYNGAFAESNGWNPKGWTRSNNAWGQQITGLNTATNGVDEGTTTAWYYNSNGAWEYGKDDIYTMPLVSNQAYVLSFKYSKHNSDWQSWLKASVLNDSDEGLEVVQFPGADDGTTYKHVKAYFTTGAAGNYILSIEQNGNAHLTDVSLIKAASSTKNISENDDAVAATVLTYYETVALTRTLSADYWNTFSVPFDAAIPEGWVVKEFDSATDNVISFKDAETLKAGKPYLVKPATTVENPTFENVIVQNTEGLTDGTGDYKFAAQIYNKELPTDGTIAYLATNGNLKLLKSGGIKGLRAYFILPANNEGARISFGDDETTGIQTVNNAIRVANDAIYDLQGRKVTSTKKGIYVVNGKKVIK